MHVLYVQVNFLLFFADVLEEYFKLKYLPDALVIFKR